MDRVRQLLDACIEGNVSLVTSLLDGGVDVDVTDDDDVTPLQVSAANGHEHLIRLLLVRGAAVDKSNTSGWTPLLHAARYGHAAVAALLIQNHADVNAHTCYGAGAAGLAARSGNLATCRLLEGASIHFGASEYVVNNDSFMLEWTPLIVAAHRGHDNIIKHLLTIGNTDYCTPSLGVSALMMAAVGGHLSTARLMVEVGNIDADALDINGRCALDYSIACGKRQLQEYLESKTTRQPCMTTEELTPEIIEAVKQGNIERIRDILDQNSSQCDACLPQDGATPLMFAAIYGHLNIAELLVKTGSDVNRQDTVSGWTALMQAVFHGQKAVAMFLIKAGADVLITAKTGCSAFDMAAVLEDVDTELYRLFATQAMPLDHSDKMLKKNRKFNTSHSQHFSSYETLSKHQGTGIKAWWSRISNRFHNLKPERSLSDGIHQSRTCVNPSLMAARNSSASSDNMILKTLTANPLTAIADVNTAHYHLTGQVKNDWLYGGTNFITPETSNTLKPVIPPFFPHMSSQTDSGPKMPPAGLRKPISNIGNSQTLLMSRPVTCNTKLLQSAHSQLNLVNRIASPPPRVQFANRPAVSISKQVDISPSASCDAATLGSSNGTAVIQDLKVLSSASSSTLTAGSDNKLSSDFKISSKHEQSSMNQSSLNKVNADRISGNEHRSLHYPCKRFEIAKCLSPVASTSTITPTTTLQRDLLQKCHSLMPDQDDLVSILHKLSLEQYQPIFEEQEVDMEAFLTLNDCDLKELGIPNAESRRQILAAISELNVRKDRERRQYKKMLTNFNETVCQSKRSLNRHCSTDSNSLIKL